MGHVRMEQYHEGVKVFQGELITHFDQNGNLASVTGDYYKNINLDTKPVITEGEAITTAVKRFGHTLSSEPSSELMVFEKNEKHHLVYRVEVVDIDSDNPADTVYFISAKNGKVIFQYDNLETANAVGTGRSLYLGNVPINTNSITGGFEMRDLTRGSQATINMRNRTSGGSIFTDADNTWGNNTTSDTASAAVDAHFGVAATWDYYKNVHGRNGIANNGSGSTSRVHYSSRYNNAFWSDSCFCMTFGDGDNTRFTPLVAIDVAAHEMTHGVTSRTARLVYSGQSGGLNEATSDIFGTATEFFANNPGDPGDYFIGEEITLFGTGRLRNMANPREDGRSIDHLSQYVSGMDVHYSSGLANQFFYLLSEGGTNRTSNQTVTGIGRAKAEKIWYRALTVYMTSGTTFAGARTATLNAAADLYGASSVERSAVAATWTACGVN
ncbi:MAG: M4 family metallopeptidase [Blastocatellia bacterium]|nr:M4 family metallopeptidase [Blastocatellia bacterium]